MKAMAKKKTTTPARTRVEEYLARPYSRLVVPELDGSFRGEIIEFPGCISMGDTAADALANLEEVAAGWLESAIAKGMRIPDPLQSNEGYSGKLVLRLPKTLHKKATYGAAREGISLNQYIVSCIAEHVGSWLRPITLSNQTVANFGFQIGVSGTSLLPIQMMHYGQPPNQQIVTSSGPLLALPFLKREEEAHA